MPVDALQALVDLEQLGSQGIAAADNAQKAMEARESPHYQRVGKDKDKDKEPSIMSPEALATAIGGAFLGGPVFGLMLGSVQGILGKKHEQNILDQNALINAAFDASHDVYKDRINDLLLTSESSGEADHLKSLLANLDAADVLLRNPYTTQQGAEVQQMVAEELNKVGINRAEREAADAQALRQIRTEQWPIYRSIKASFDQEVKPYKNIMEQTSLALDALYNGSPSRVFAAMKWINKALDETSAVMEGEVKATERVGSLKDKVLGFMGGLETGTGMLDERRRDFIGLMYDIRKTATEFQIARQDRAIDEAFDWLEIDGHMPGNVLDNFNITDSIPAYTPPGFTPRNDGDRVRNAADELVDNTEQEINFLLGLFKQLTGSGQ